MARVLGALCFVGGVVQAQTTVSTWREQAENTNQVTATVTSARSAVQSAVVSEGLGAFQLAHPTFTDETIVLSPVILPSSTTKLFFESRLGWATTNQVATAQVSTNNGATWATLWSQAGTGGAGQGGFALVTLPLAAYAGTPIKTRFLYDFTGVSAYTDVTPGVGWFIDNIQIGSDLIKQRYTATGEPTAAEIQILEFINRARADAVAEATRLSTSTDPDVVSANTFFGVNFAMMNTQFAALPRTVPPLAMNAKLLAAARLHSQDMFNNVFQSHVSSASPVPPNQPGDDIATRVGRQGYAGSTYENVYSYAKSAWHSHAGFNIDWGGTPATGGMQSPAGHRLAIHNGDLREAGIGVVVGSRTNGTNVVGPLLVTHNLGTQTGGGAPLITGVTYTDLDGDKFYDPGEGLGGVRVDVDGSSFFATSSTNGAYAVPVPTNGTYQVTFSPRNATPVRRGVTVVSNNNVKVDYRGEFLRINSIQRISSNTVRLIATVAQTATNVTIRTSSDFQTWTNAANTRTNLPGGLIQIDTTLPATANQAYFQVEAAWAP